MSRSLRKLILGGRLTHAGLLQIRHHPFGESDILCCAVQPGTILICTEPAEMEPTPNGKSVQIKSRLIDGGNKLGGTFIPLCKRHGDLFDRCKAENRTFPFEYSIPPSPILKNGGR